MGWATGVMVYLVIWWTVLFAILPLGVRRAQSPGPGHDPGAPEKPDLKRKVVITSVVAALIWVLFFGLQEAGILTFENLFE